MIGPQDALIYLMVLVSASDRDMTDAELQTIGDTVRKLPIFEGYEQSRLTATAQECAELLGKPNGLDTAFELIVGALPERVHETAYALACDIAAADGRASQEELRLLEMARDRLSMGRLEAAAIERGTRALHDAIR